jgi:hypothetical protein
MSGFNYRNKPELKSKTTDLGLISAKEVVRIHTTTLKQKLKTQAYPIIKFSKIKIDP